MSQKKKMGRNPLAKERSEIWPFEHQKKRKAPKPQKAFSPFCLFQQISDTIGRAANGMLFSALFLKGIWKTLKN
jgi:hypothetical protein